jgi:hypothetical protein
LDESVAGGGGAVPFGNVDEEAWGALLACGGWLDAPPKTKVGLTLAGAGMVVLPPVVEASPAAAVESDPAAVVVLPKTKPAWVSGIVPAAVLGAAVLPKETLG